VRTPLPSDAWSCSTLQGVMSLHASPSISAVVQAPGPPVGSVEVTTCPVESAATQSEIDGQAIDVSTRPLSIVDRFQGPVAGLVENSRTPGEPTATHSEAEGQATLARVSGTGVVVQDPAPGGSL
jgi:hypothetical protein